MSTGVKLVPLGDLCRLVGGGTPPKDKPEFYGGDIPWATVRDMRSDIIAETEFKVTREAVVASATNVIPAGNVVIATRVGLGKVCLIEQPTAINQDLRGVIPIDPTTLTIKYLYWWLKSVAHLIEKEGTGATVQGVKLPFIKSLRLPLCPIDEQRRIVAVLDDAFERIATATANAERNKRNARELFDSKLFSLIAHCTDGWPRKTLREIALDFGRGKSKHRPRDDARLYGGPYPFIQTGDVRGAEHLITEFTQTYSQEGLAQSKLWPRGTLCITIAANIAETGVLGFDACFPDSVIGVVVDESQTSSKYLEYMLHTFKAELKAKGKGSAQDNINLATFENQRFPFPSLDEQARIVGLMDEISYEVQRFEALYSQKLNALSDLRMCLLHRAFAGEPTKGFSADLRESVYE